MRRTASSALQYAAYLLLVPCNLTGCLVRSGDWERFVDANDPDGDGWYNWDDTGDCAPEDPAINPGAEDVANDEIDQDCDGWERIRRTGEDRVEDLIHIYSNDSESYFGRQPVSLGDLDGDGRSEFAIGEPYWDIEDQSTNGRVVFFRLDEDSLQSGATMDVTDLLAGDDVGEGQAAYWMGPVNSRLGSDLVTGDWNGDGQLDLAVVAADDNEYGKVWIRDDLTDLFGTDSFVSQEVDDAYDPVINTLTGDEGTYGPARGLGNISDLFEEGTDNLILSNQPPFFSAANSWPDSAAYVGVLCERPAGDELSTSDLCVVWADQDASSPGFGARTAAGDVDGDGVPDLIVSAIANNGVESWADGAVFLTLGDDMLDAKDDPVVFSDRKGENGVGGWIAGMGLGHSLALEDLDGDGRLDLSVGAPGRSAVYILNGDSIVSTLHSTSDQMPELTAIMLLDTDAEFGFSQAAPGDVDRDGMFDLAVDAPRFDGDRGQVWLLYGPLSGDAPSVVELTTGDETQLHVEGDGTASLGFATAAAGDIDGDTVPDILLGPTPSVSYWGGDLWIWRPGREL